MELFWFQTLDLFNGVINFIVFVKWGQFIMMTTQTATQRGLIYHDDHTKL